MNNVKTMQFKELSSSECMEINAKGWLVGFIAAALAYIADDWAGFKSGIADGMASEQK